MKITAVMDDTKLELTGLAADGILRPSLWDSESGELCEDTRELRTRTEFGGAENVFSLT